MPILKDGNQIGLLMELTERQIFTYYSLPNMVFENLMILKLENFGAARHIYMMIDTTRHLSHQNSFGLRFDLKKYQFDLLIVNYKKIAFHS